MFHGGQNLFAVQLIPGGGDDGGSGIMGAKQGNHGVYGLVAHSVGAAENNGTGVFDLIVVKFPKVFHVDLYFGGIGYGGETVERNIF